jgi:hypothetical protein
MREIRTRLSYINLTNKQRNISKNILTRKKQI